MKYQLYAMAIFWGCALGGMRQLVKENARRPNPLYKLKFVKKALNKYDNFDKDSRQKNCKPEAKLWSALIKEALGKYHTPVRIDVTIDRYDDYQPDGCCAGHWDEIGKLLNKTSTLNKKGLMNILTIMDRKAQRDKQCECCLRVGLTLTCPLWWPIFRLFDTRTLAGINPNLYGLCSDPFD